ncbi:Alpha/Beta hydrolase protein [Chlamydoabsidia padenii]|nr:Alpha/Beta hydrolase protein [Chlamydoabsidia padenii]
MTVNTISIDSEKATIEVRIGYNQQDNYSPKSTTATPASAPAIVIAHPYGPLGGNMYNNVVVALQKSLMNKGYITASFNFRGSGNSTGRTSWTGIPEQKDYKAVVDYLLKQNDGHKDLPTVSHLLVCGYSYGSMIAASIRENRVPTSYLLISYPLRVAWALSLTKMSYFRSQVNQLLTASPTIIETNESQQQSSPLVLLIFGDQDQFTSINAYRSWVKTITSNTAKSIIVEGVDHFWADKENQLLDHMYSWLSTIPSLSSTQ